MGFLTFQREDPWKNHQKWPKMAKNSNFVEIWILGENNDTKHASTPFCHKNYNFVSTCSELIAQK